MSATWAVSADVEGDGPALLLVHGQPGGANDWRRVVRALGGRYRTIAYDRPGYGRTGGPPGDFRANAAAAVALLDRLGVERAVVAGHSWGGGVALEMARWAPERTAGLVLAASVAPGMGVGAVDRLLATRPFGDVAALAVLGTAERALAVPAVRAAAGRLLPAGRRELVASTAPSPRSWRAFAYEQRVFVDQVDRLEAGLEDLKVPAEVVIGTADRVVGPASAAVLAGLIPGARLRRVAGAGHLLLWEHPEEVAAALEAASLRH